MTAPVGGLLELDELEQLVNPGIRNRGRERERAQMVAAGATRIEVARFEHSTDPARRMHELPVGATEDERLPGRRAREAEQQPQGRRLAGAVGTEEPGDRSRDEART